MTISSEVSSSQTYTGNGFTTVFTYPFRILSASHIRAVVLESSGLASDLSPLDYDVSGVGNEDGGNVTLKFPLAAGKKLTLVRSVPIVQETSLPNGGPYFAETVEKAFDLTVMQIQQLDDAVGRSLKVEPGQDAPSIDQIASAQAAAAAAIGAANGNFTFSIRSVAQAASIPSVIHQIVLNGQAAAGDGLGGLYIDTNNGSSDTFTTNGGTRTWYRSANAGRDFSLTLTVGAGGNYSTLNAAVVAASLLGWTRYKLGGLTTEIRLLTGFVLNEQVLIKGVDLSFITITSVDAVVMINPAGITAQLAGADGGEPAFGAIDGGKLPRIGVQFEYQTQQTTTKSGVIVFGGSSVEFLPGSGVRKAARGLSVYHSSKAFCTIPGYRSVDAALPGVYSVDFSSSYGRGLDVQHGSSIALPRSKFNDCAIIGTDIAVYGIWDARLDLTQSQVRNAKCVGDDLAAVRIRDCSTLCFREGDVSGSLAHGIYGSHLADIDFRQKAGGGVTASQGARNCALAAVYVDGSCKIEVTELVATNCCTANSAWATLTAAGCSTIMADICDVSGSKGRGIECRGGSAVSANGANANNCTVNALYARSTGRINFESGTATGCLDTAYFAELGGEIDAASSVATGAGTQGALARRGARMTLRSANVRRGASDAATDIVCAQGSIIDATGSTGGTSIAVNTVSGSGIIFQ